MFELIFRDRDTGHVNYAVTEVTLIRHITPSEVGFTDKEGHIRSSSFIQTENLEIVRINPMSDTNPSSLDDKYQGHTEAYTASDILAKANALKDKGNNEAYIAQELGISTSRLRRLRAEEAAKSRQDQITRSNAMKSAGYSNFEIADALGLAENDVRIILAD